MSGLSQEARALIEGTLELDEPSAGDKSRIQQRLMLQLGAAAFAASALSGATAGGSGAAVGGGMTQAAGVASKGLGSIAPKGFWLSGLGKALVGAAALGGIGIAWWAAAPTPSQELAQAPRTLAPVVAPAPAVVPELAPAPAEAVPAQLVQDPAPAVAATSPRPSAKARSRIVAAEPKPAEQASGTLKAELALLGRAQAALRAGRYQEALSLTGEHRSQFPDGMMKEERMGVAALAACALSPERRQEAEVFLKQAASSPLAARVKKACNLP